MKLIEIVANIICNTLSDPDALGRARLRKGAFTRNCGKLPFWTMMELLLQNAKLSISSMLDGFFSTLRKKMGGSIPQAIHCPQQAFSKARAGISHTIFQECFENILDFLCCKESLDYDHRLGGLWGFSRLQSMAQKSLCQTGRPFLKNMAVLGEVPAPHCHSQHCI